VWNSSYTEDGEQPVDFETDEELDKDAEHGVWESTGSG
jgi:hypothetical protein